MIILFCSVPVFLFCGGRGLEIYKFVVGGNSLVTKLCLTLVTPCTVAYRAPLSRQGSWSGLPFPSLGDLPSPGIEPSFPVLQTDCLLLSHQESPYKFITYLKIQYTILQGVFLTQGLNPGLLHCRQILYQLSHQVCHFINKWS